MSQMRPDVAFIDEWLEVPCYADPADRWNGWACPWFTLDAVRAIAEKYNAAADPDDGEFVQITDGTDPNRPEIVLVSRDDDGENREVLDAIDSEWGLLWPVGAYGWTWLLRSDYPVEALSS